MKVGIIVYSKTGNTLAVAERISSQLEADGIAASIERFSAETLPQSNKPVRLTAVPNPNKFDAVIFGAPVQAFSLDPAMALYFEQINSINPKNVFCFVTQHFKKPWLGGVLGLVPGLGYVYSGEYANAARSLILNGL